MMLSRTAKGYCNLLLLGTFISSLIVLYYKHRFSGVNDVWPELKVVEKEIPAHTNANRMEFREDHLQSVRENESRDEVKTQFEEVNDQNFQGRAQDDPGLIAYIRKHLIHPPSKKPYKLLMPKKKHFSQYKQTQFAEKEVFKGMRGGFFLEAGAVDGEVFSNTLFLERERGWTGLLIEPFEETFAELLKKNRKAYSIQAALSTTNVSSEIVLMSAGPKGMRGYIKGTLNYTVPDMKAVKVKALPLYSILKALDVTQIDFFSLDIEGAELKVLKTVPWNKIKVRLMCVESNHLPEGAPALRKYMKGVGYSHELGTKGIDEWFGWPELLHQT